MTARQVLAEHIAGLRLVDNHVHGYWLTGGDRRRFENGLNEANTEPLADFDSGFDTQLGFAVRAHCAPILGLMPHAEPHMYWERRSERTAAGLAGLFLAGQRLQSDFEALDGVLPGSCGRSSCATGVFDGPLVLIDFHTQVSNLCAFGSVVPVSALINPF